MRRSSVVLAFAVLAGVARAGGGKVKIAKIYMAGDRIVEGEVTAEDEHALTLKTELAEAPFPKSEILYTVRSELTPEELAARKRSRSTYTSLLLGYKLRKPDEWAFKFDPPEPLSDVAIRSGKDEMVLDVFGVPDKDPQLAFDDDASLKNVTQTLEAKLREKFVDVKRTRSDKTKIKDLPAFYLEFSLRSKDSRKEFKQGELVLRSKGKILFFDVSVPAAKFDKAKAIFDDVIATVEFTESNPQEGDRQWNQEFLYAIEKPSDWTFAKAGELQAPRNEAWVRVEPSKLDAATSLDAWSKELEPSLAASLSAAKKVSSSSANICGRLGHQWVFEYSEGASTRRRIVSILKDQERGYRITADMPKEKEQYPPLVSEVL